MALPQDQGNPTPASAQASEPVIEFQGKSYTASDFAKQHEASIRGMNEAQERASRFEKEATEYKSWAEPIRERYNADPDGFNSWWNTEGGSMQRAQPNVLDPAWQRLETQDRDIAKLKLERDFDNLKARGFELSDDMRLEVAREIATNPSIRDVEAAYKKLYWDRALNAARESAVSDTAEALRTGRRTKPMPEGGARPASPPDLSKLSRNEKRELAVERIKDMPYFFGE